MTAVTPLPPSDDQKAGLNPRPNLAHPGVLLATWFGAGYLPKAPGTWGSLGALPFAWLILEHGGPWVLLGAIVMVTAIGILAANDFMDRTGTEDPAAIVIDEVAGQWIVLLAAPPDLAAFALGFALFRFFDVLKPWPISWADRAIGGAFGVMLDDLLAGLFGLIAMAFAIHFGGPYFLGVFD